MKELYYYVHKAKLSELAVFKEFIIPEDQGYFNISATDPNQDRLMFIAFSSRDDALFCLLEDEFAEDVHIPLEAIQGATLFLKNNSPVEDRETFLRMYVPV